MLKFFFNLREKVIDYLRDYSFSCYLKLNTKQNMEKVAQY